VRNIYVFSVSTRDIYIENLRQAAASDTYVLRGDPVGEIYEPTYSFVYHSLRPIFDLSLDLLIMVFVICLYLIHLIR
jgi:hypothetical protein